MYATKCHNCLTWIKPISVLLVQGTIVHTDRSQSRSESLADVHPIRSWDGMNVGCLSLGSGNIREEEEEEKEKKQTNKDVSFQGDCSASCRRLTPSLVLPSKTFCSSREKDTTTN